MHCATRNPGENGEAGKALHLYSFHAQENDIEDWTSGYVADVGYTYGYYTELNPQAAQIAFLAAGQLPPRIETACELGFGQGVSVNFHAAASPVRWFGTDFNPSQAGFAQELARISGSNAALFDESFAQFCARPDLPQLDFIALHGIWSWINDENRRLIVDFVRRKLSVGGVLYISYNTQPGWASMVPMRDLFMEHTSVMASPGQGRLSKVDAALAFADKLMAAKPGFAAANPSITERLKKLTALNRSYLAHEYFNQDWQPMSFSAMAQWLGPAKLSYACSANPIDQVDSVNLTPEQLALLAEIPDAGFRQTVRDFCVNQQFRKDYWVKGARTLTALEQFEGLRRLSFVLLMPVADVTMKAVGSKGELTLNEAIYAPILEAFADHQPKSLARVHEVTQPKSITFAQLVQAVQLLTAKGALQLAQEPRVASEAKKATQALNRHLISTARFGREMNFLASPVTGGGVYITHIQQLFLNSILQGRETPEQWAADAWSALVALGQRLLREGKTVESEQENMAELQSQARLFAEKRLPILKALQAF